MKHFLLLIILVLGLGTSAPAQNTTDNSKQNFLVNLLQTGSDALQSKLSKNKPESAEDGATHEQESGGWNIFSLQSLKALANEQTRMDMMKQFGYSAAERLISFQIVQEALASFITLALSIVGFIFFVTLLILRGQRRIRLDNERILDLLKRIEKLEKRN